MDSRPAPTKKRDVEWECPICLETKFPIVGKCGHCICEYCVEKVVDCPTCRMEKAFADRIPCWGLATAIGVERRKPGPNPFESIVVKDLTETFKIINNLNTLKKNIFDSKSEMINSIFLAGLQWEVNKLENIFEHECAIAYTKKIMEEFERHGYNVVKIDSSKNLIRESLLIKHIKKSFSLISSCGVAVSFRHRMLTCTKKSW